MKRILVFCLLMVNLCAWAQEFPEGHVFRMKTSNLAEKYNLYPESKIYDEGYLQVTSTHKIYYAQLGNPSGVPALYLHGGPMAGNNPSVSQYFDPSFYRIIMFDQRGAGKSIPHALVEENTTQDLIEDIVNLKNHLGIDTWLVSGGSWGSALAMAYGEAHPGHVTGFILRGIFDGSQKSYNHLLYGMGQTYPDAYDEFVSYLPKEERGDLLKAYYDRLMDTNPKVHMPAAKVFVKYDTICGMLNPDDDLVMKELEDERFVLAISRGFFHYSKHGFFMNDKQIIHNLHKIAHLPSLMVHGQHDTICPAEIAYEVHQAWPKSSLMFVQDAGHFATEPGISLGLVAASEAFKLRLMEEEHSSKSDSTVS